MKPSLLLHTTGRISHRQEKQNMRTAYRQSVNRFKVKKMKTGSAGIEHKKTAGVRGDTILVFTSTGRRTWKRPSSPNFRHHFPAPSPFSLEEAWEDAEALER